MITQLEIAIQSTYDTNLGSGPIASALNWECASRLNKVGAFSFEMPLADSKRSLLVAKRYVRCYGIVNDAWTELGKPGIIERIARSIDGEGVPTGMIRIEGTDLFGELADIQIHELDIIDTDTRTPDSVQYYDGTATAYLNMANTFDGNDGTGVAVPADDEDWIYVGDADPFDITDWHLGANRNSDTGNFRVEYSQGASSWGSGTILSDTTKANKTDDPNSPSNWGASWWQVDGQIRWERQEDWATDTVNSIADMYWLRFRYSEDMTAAANGGTIDVNEIEIIQEIPTATALTLWQEYEDVDTNTPISTLGWDFEATHTETQNTVFLKLREVSAFKALAMIAEQTGENFRLGSGREIEWLQDDKIASGIVATNAIDATAGASATTNCWITSFRQSSDAHELVGRVYPRGGGRGATRVNLLECTRDVPGTDYTGYVLSQSLNYLEKTSVETDYGRPIERAMYWPELMSPNAANAKDINVANALFDLTYQYLQRHWEPQTAYDIEVVKLDSAVAVGTTLQVAYWQTVDGSAIMDVGVDGTAIHLWVLESTQRVDNKGLRSVAMKIATTDAWPISAGSKMQEVVHQVLAIQATDGPMGAGSLTVRSVGDLLGSLDLNAYYKKPTNTKVVLGLDAGNVPPADNHGVFVGNEAGYNSTSGQDNTFLGYRSGRAATTGYDNTMVGSDSMRLGLGTGNTGLGYRVLENVGATTDGLLNTAVGHQAMRAMDEGDYNVAMGSDAMSLAQSSYNVGIGYLALQDIGTTSDGDYNTAIGYAAMLQGDQGEYNVAVGASALQNATDGDSNTAVGMEAMASGSGAPVSNVAIGYQAMYGGGTSPTGNVAIGDSAGLALDTGNYNVAIGFESMRYNAASSNNIVIGYRAGYKGSATTYDDCVIIGYQAGYVLETGDNNVLIGHQAGLALTGAANVFIGYLSGSQAVGVSNQLYIENSNSATPLIYGEFDNDLVKIHGDLCLGTEDGLGRLNFTEGTTIADGIVWGSDANKVTLYRSADDVLKTDDSFTVGIGVNIGTGTGAAMGSAKLGSTGEVWLDLNSDTDANSADTNVGMHFYVDAAVEKGYMFYDQGLDVFKLGYGGIAGITMNSSSDVGIGCTPSYRLDVEDNLTGFVAHLFNDGDNADREGLWVQAGADDGSGVTSYLLGKDGNNDTVGAVRNNNGTFEIFDGSDERRKKDIVPTTSILGELRQVAIVDFSWRNKAPGVRHTGFIAQQLHEHFPKIGMCDEKQDWWGVALTKMIPINTKAIQEVDAEVVALKQRVTDLESV